MLKVEKNDENQLDIEYLNLRFSFKQVDFSEFMCCILFYVIPSAKILSL